MESKDVPAIVDQHHLQQLKFEQAVVTHSSVTEIESTNTTEVLISELQQEIALSSKLCLLKVCFGSFLQAVAMIFDFTHDFHHTLYFAPSTHF